MTAVSRAEAAVGAARQQVWLHPCDQTIDSLITAVRAHAAEQQREAIRKTDDPVFYEGEAGWLPDLIDPKAAVLVPEVEVRYAYGPVMRLADFTVTTDADHPGRLDVVGRLTSGTAWPQPGDAVPLAHLGIPGRGALADVAARIELSSRDDDTLVRIRVTINPEETQ